MCIIKVITSFISIGAKTFRVAASGKYDFESDSIKQIRKEMLEKDSTRSSDLENLKRDQKMISGDVRSGFNKLVLKNG